MNVEPVIVSRRNGRACCDFAAIPAWEGLEKMAEFLEKFYGARIRERIDGPDARRWILDVDGGTVELHHEDPYGNELISMSPATDDLITRIAADLRTRLGTLEK